MMKKYKYELFNKLSEMGCDIDDALDRLCIDEEFLSENYVLLLDDLSKDTVSEPLEKEDWNMAFRMMHKKKGVYLNLGLSYLKEYFDIICESLRKATNEEALPHKAYFLKTAMDFHKQEQIIADIIKECQGNL
ncbi:MAG: hypothetical protein MJ113_01940 [Lachnospiraceae bacterium]|nr:hypothetical protein [Lachnospiraceae bacterium]